MSKKDSQVDEDLLKLLLGKISALSQQVANLQVEVANIKSEVGA